jgi:hypothetical protein
MDKVHFKSKEYFEEESEFNSESLALYEKKYLDEETEKHHKRKLSYTLFRASVEQVYLRYSCGADKKELTHLLIAVLRSLRIYLNENQLDSYEIESLSDYSHVVRLISLAFLLEVDIELFGEFKTLLTKSVNDKFISKIIEFKECKEQSATAFVYPDQYQKLYEVLLSKDASSISKYLKTKYYRSFRDAYWYDTHKKEDSGFFGYWCFEVAAFVKGLGFSITEDLRESPFFPERLL